MYQIMKQPKRLNRATLHELRSRGYKIYLRALAGNLNEITRTDREGGNMHPEVVRSERGIGFRVDCVEEDDWFVCLPVVDFLEKENGCG